MKTDIIIEEKIKRFREKFVIPASKLSEDGKDIVAAHSDEVEQFLREALTEVGKQQREEELKKFKKQFEEIEITYPVINPQITDSDMTVFQARALINQSIVSVVDQLRKKIKRFNINSNPKEQKI